MKTLYRRFAIGVVSLTSASLLATPAIASDALASQKIDMSPTVAASSYFECDNMSHRGQPATYITVFYKRAKYSNGFSFTKILPKNNAGKEPFAAVVGRVYNGATRFYRGPYVYNTTSQYKTSYISSRVGYANPRRSVAHMYRVRNVGYFGTFKQGSHCHRDL